MKKLLLTLIGLLAALSPALASRTAAMNILDRTATISSRGVQAIYDIAAKEPGQKVAVEQAFGTPLIQGDLEVVNRYVVLKGKTYLNSGLDAQRMPIQHPSVAEKDTTFFLIRSKATGKLVSIKDICLNVGQVRLEALPYSPKPSDTTWNINEVDVRISLSLKQEQNNNQQLTANASTGPINIVFNNVTSSPPLMNAAGNNSNPFFVTRDSRGIASLGFSFGGQTKIYGGTATVGPITVNNANDNVVTSANNTVVNTGGGTATGTATGTGTGTAKAGGG
ncbi:MAG: hypothetical protein Q8O94_04015 [bacterium]|nr:hypothetical protein [bacterium]